MGTLKVLSNSSEPFSDRLEAGRKLASELDKYRDKNVVVLGIPRGGVVVAAEIAKALHGDLDIVLAHKLGAPMNPELAIGAVCEDGKIFINRSIASYVGATDEYIESEKNSQLEVMAARVDQCRRVLGKIDLQDRIVIVTDDGIATGATMEAALWVVRQERPKKLIAALPVGPDDSLYAIAGYTDETLCLRTPAYFGALGSFYYRFEQVEDFQMLEILQHEAERRVVK